MILTYNNERKRYEFATTPSEKNTAGEKGKALARNARFVFDWEKLVWWTQSPLRALDLAAYCEDDTLRSQIHALAKSEGTPRLTYRGGVFIWTGPIEGKVADATGTVRYIVFKDIPRNAGFVFAGPRSPEKWELIPAAARDGLKGPVWWTADADRALACIGYADDEARVALQQLHQRKTEALALSRATDANIQIPAPDGLNYLGYQRAGIAYGDKRRSVLFGDEMGLGKQTAVDTRVLTPLGWTTAGDVRVGERIIGSTGKGTNVTGVYPQGVKPSYRVTFSDHSSVEAGPEHLWTMRYRRGGRVWAEIVLTTEQLRLRPKLGTLDLAKTTLYLPMLTAPVEFEYQSTLPIPPYSCGALIANGAISQGANLVTNALDAEEIGNFLTVEGMSYPSPRTYGGATRFSLRGLTGAIQSLGLNTTSRFKFIPAMYRLGSVEERIALLQGLMDSDGSTNGRGALTYHTISLQLAQDVQQLVEQLGGISSIRTYDRSRESKPVEYQVRLRLPSAIKPFRTTRKTSRLKPGRLANPCRTLLKVEYVRDVESVCFAVDAPDRLFAVDHCILTHNTIQSIGLINLWLSRCTADQISRFRCVVICPASLKLNWQRELERWLVFPLTIGLSDSSRAQAIPSTNIVICNYEQLSRDELTGKEVLNKAKTKLIPERVKVLRQALRILWHVLIIDECHKIKNPEAIRTQMAFSLTAKRSLFLSGTPLVNRPKELWGLAHHLAPTVFPNKWDFLRRYCQGESSFFGQKWDGAQNLEELQEKMRSHFLIRRLKKDVLKELPPKRRQVIELPATGCEGVVAEELTAWRGKDEKIRTLKLAVELAKASERPDDYKKAVALLKAGIQVAFAEMSRLRYQTAVAKIPVVIEHVEAALAEGNKVILFAHHKEVVAKIAARFAAETVTLTGDTKMADRDAAVSAFQENDSVRLFIGSIMAAGVGLTLTASSHVIFAELDWVPGNVTQAEDRAHRIGQHDSVLVQHLVLEGSLDARMAQTLVEKQDISDRALDIQTEAEKETADKKFETLVDASQSPVPVFALPEKDEFATHRYTPKDIAAEAVVMSKADISAVHLGVKLLAGRCDGAQAWDGAGFSQFDVPLGHYLADLKSLTPRYAALGKKLLLKYRNTQLAGIPEVQRLFVKGKTK